MRKYLSLLLVPLFFNLISTLNADGEKMSDLSKKELTALWNEWMNIGSSSTSSIYVFEQEGRVNDLPNYLKTITGLSSGYLVYGKINVSEKYRNEVFEAIDKIDPIITKEMLEQIYRVQEPLLKYNQIFKVYDDKGKLYAKGTYSKVVVPGYFEKMKFYYIKDELIPQLGTTGPAGGVVVYDKGYWSEGWRFLEVSKKDFGKTKWADSRICYEHEENGFEDWFLPSKDELLNIFVSFSKMGIGLFKKEDYWTSSDGNEDYAYAVGFRLGFANYYKKDMKMNVRCIRSFW